MRKRRQTSRHERTTKNRLHDIREAAGKFKNQGEKPPRKCPHCQMTELAIDKIRARGMFPGKLEYLYCTTCREPLFIYPPTIEMSAECDTLPATPSPPTNPSGEHKS